MNPFFRRILLVCASTAGSLCWLVSSAVTNDPSAAAQIRALQLQVGSLEERVHDLEKNVRGIALMERERGTQPNDAMKKPGEAGKGSIGSKVGAPFVVSDDAGHELFRVELGPVSKQPRFVLGNESGAHVVVAADDEQKKAEIQLFGPSKDKSSALIEASKNPGLQIVTADRAHRANIGLASNGALAFVLTYNEVHSASLYSGPTGEGYLGLFDASGRTMVEAGTLGEGVGEVRTGPQCCSTPTVGPHTHIRGRKPK